VGTKYVGCIEIGDTCYRWNVKRIARAGYHSLTGVSLYVFVEEGKGRDLILDFPYGELGHADKTRDHSAVVVALRECIPLALQAGVGAVETGKAAASRRDCAAEA
jgi:hypothetical protein